MLLFMLMWHTVRIRTLHPVFSHRSRFHFDIYHLVAWYRRRLRPISIILPAGSHTTAVC